MKDGALYEGQFDHDEIQVGRRGGGGAAWLVGVLATSPACLVLARVKLCCGPTEACCRSLSLAAASEHSSKAATHMQTRLAPLAPLPCNATPAGTREKAFRQRQRVRG